MHVLFYTNLELFVPHKLVVTELASWGLLPSTTL